MSFQSFCEEVEESDNQIIQARNSFLINFSKTNGSAFSIDPMTVVSFLRFFSENYDECIKIISENENFNKSKKPTQYQEKPYRALYKQDRIAENSELNKITSLGGSQTKPLTQVIAKLVSFLSNTAYASVDIETNFHKEIIDQAIANIPNDLTELAAKDPTPNKKNNKEKFERWMHKNGASDRTIKSYSVTVMNAANKFLKEQLSISDSIYDIDSPETLDSLTTKLKSLSTWEEKNKDGNGMYDAGLKKYELFLQGNYETTSSRDYKRISKPFILLAGISGTGKTRFVREQARKSAPDFQLDEGENYCLVPVRPDWHEPSDLFGYISRLNGVQYVATDFLKFVFKALSAAISDIDGSKIIWKKRDDIPPFWLCLDEMNLAPVEQYFADYLSIIETREWSGDTYKSEALLKKGVFDSLRSKTSFSGSYDDKDSSPSPIGSLFDEIFSSISIANDLKRKLIDYVTNYGLLLPPNLIVAGTVNMDETTHGFSRKVIDRALTFDFGEFFPNDFDAFFVEESKPVLLSFPVISKAKEESLKKVLADPDGEKTINFLKAVNEVLFSTPFELAYRALNELLLSVVSFSPSSSTELQAVWDDFMMCKVLPRIDGDIDKLAAVSKSGTGDTILDQLENKLKEQFSDIWIGEIRPDLLRESVNSDDPTIAIKCRSNKKLKWMKDRLEKNTFTSFWP